MRERPIIFSGAMVRAILDGRKTQTRRVVKPQPPTGHAWHGFTAFSTKWSDEGKAVWALGDSPLLRDVHRVRCPYGHPGDRLWVREAWAEVHPLQVADGRQAQAGRAGIPGPPPVDYRVVYRADGEYPPIYCLGGEPWPYRSLEPFERDGIQAFVDQLGWTPSIHMPRWASRITLQITGVRVERLQDISEADAQAEGVIPAMAICDDDGVTHRDAFGDLWESINGAGSWAANPWVWVIEFKQSPERPEVG